MAMSVGNLKRAAELVEWIEDTQKLIAAYSEAETVTIGIEEKTIPGTYLAHRVTLQGYEIRADIVNTLMCKIGQWEAELRELGVDPQIEG